MRTIKVAPAQIMQTRATFRCCGGSDQGDKKLLQTALGFLQEDLLASRRLSTPIVAMVVRRMMRMMMKIVMLLIILVVGTGKARISPRKGTPPAETPDCHPRKTKTCLGPRFATDVRNRRFEPKFRSPAKETYMYSHAFRDHHRAAHLGARFSGFVFSTLLQAPLPVSRFPAVSATWPCHGEAKS